MYEKKWILKQIEINSDVSSTFKEVTKEFRNYQENQKRRDDLSFFGFSIAWIFIFLIIKSLKAHCSFTYMVIMENIILLIIMLMSLTKIKNFLRSLSLLIKRNKFFDGTAPNQTKLEIPRVHLQYLQRSSWTSMGWLCS